MYYDNTLSVNYISPRKYTLDRYAHTAGSYGYKARVRKIIFFGRTKARRTPILPSTRYNYYIYFVYSTIVLAITVFLAAYLAAPCQGRSWSRLAQNGVSGGARSYTFIVRYL